MKKKCTLSLLIVLVLCLALSGCGRKGKQSEALTANNTSSAGSSSDRDSGEDSESSSDQDSEENGESSSDKNTGKNIGRNTGKNTGSSTGRTTGKNTGSSTGRNTGKNTGKKTGNTDNAVDNKSDKNTGKVIAQTTGSSSSTDSSSGSGSDSNMGSSSGQDAGSSAGSDSGSGSGSNSGGGSGSGSGGGKTPPSKGNKVVKSVADISDVTVEYGTDAAAAAAKLPGTVVLNCTDGSTIKGSVASWEVDTSYNARPAEQTAYTAIGKVTIPDGNKSYYGTTLKATVKIIVRGGDTVIESVINPVPIEVKYGTKEVDAMKQLPTEVRLQCVSGNSTFATVTWSRRSKTYVEKPDGKGALIRYAGTVKIPDGYQLDSSAKMTIVTSIRVNSINDDVEPKSITAESAVSEISIPYTTDEDEIKKNLPDKIRLYCKDKGSVITVAVDKGRWKSVSTQNGSGDYSTEKRFAYSYEDISLPDSYAFETTIDKTDTSASAVIYVKKRDNTKLKTAVIVARNLYYNDRITSDEKFAGGENDKIYVAPEGTTPAQVTAGIKFIVNSGENKKALDAVYYLVDTGEGEIQVFSSDIDSYKPNESQAFVDQKAEEINAATAALRKILDNNYQIGTCFKTKNIVNNVKALLESESFKKGGNYAYDSANYPMILGQEYMLPQYVTVVVDAKGTKAEVELEWKVKNSDITFDYKDTDANGKKLRNAVVTPKSTYDNQPKMLSCVVSVVGYQNGNDRVNLGNEQVEAYNNCLVRAPLYQETSVNFDRPVLTSGTENTFTVKVAFPYYKYYKYVERIEPDRITVKNADNYTTSDGKPLLSDMTVTGVNTNQDSQPYLPEFTITATAAPLDAVSDLWLDDSNRGVNGKVELSIPADAITLTEYAKEQGWYLPEDGLELKAELDIRKPVVTVDSITSESNNGVRIEFSTAYWSGSSDVRVAFLKQSLSEFSDNESEYDISISDAVSVHSDGTHRAYINTFSLEKGDYKVWVKVGDGKWLKTDKAYTLSDTQTHAAGLAGLAASPVLELPADGAEEEQPAVTVEDAQLSEDRSWVTVAFRTTHCSGSSVQTALVPNALDAFDGTAAGSFVAEDVVTVEADGAYTADISASGIPAGDYTVWVKAGDGDWQKSTVTYTHTAADLDTDADSDTNTGAGSDADPDTNTGTGSDADPDTNTGTGSDADTDTNSGTAAGTQAGGSQDGLVPENEVKPDTEEDNPAAPDEGTHERAQSSPAGSDGCGE